MELVVLFWVVYKALKTFFWEMFPAAFEYTHFLKSIYFILPPRFLPYFCVWMNNTQHDFTDI